MPKITTLKRRIAGVLTELVLSYDVKTSKFFISAGIPDKMLSLHSNYSLNSHDTQASVEYALDKRIKDYEAQIKSERKVLLITVALGKECLNAIDLPKSHPFKSWTHSGFYSKPANYGFDIKVEIALETSTGDKKQYRYPEQDEGIFQAMRGSSITPDVQKGLTRIIDWTPEREEYFKSIIAATLAIGQKMADFFHEDEQLFLENVDGGQKLLGQ